MEEIKRLIRQTILVNYGLKGKYIDRLINLLIKQIIINELDNYLDMPYIEEMLYAENKEGIEVHIDSSNVDCRPNLHFSENSLEKKYTEEFRLLDECLKG